MPRLSIVLATFNAAGTVERLFASLSAQTFRDFELIVVDGGSTDGTVEIIKRHADSIAYWHSRPDQGIYDAWNQGLSRATGEYVAFLGADDAWHAPDSLATMFDTIGENEFDFVSARGRLVDHQGRLLQEFGHAWDYRKVTRRMIVCHPGALHRRDLFDRFGMFDTRYRISADYDFLLRLPRNLRGLFIDQPLVDVAEGGISRDNRWLMLRERYRAQADCPRVGRARAIVNFIDKLWRIPLAHVLGMRN